MSSFEYDYDRDNDNEELLGTPVKRGATVAGGDGWHHGDNDRLHDSFTKDI